MVGRHFAQERAQISTLTAGDRLAAFRLGTTGGVEFPQLALRRVHGFCRIEFARSFVRGWQRAYHALRHQARHAGRDYSCRRECSGEAGGREFAQADDLRCGRFAPREARADVTRRARETEHDR